MVEVLLTVAGKGGRKVVSVGGRVTTIGFVGLCVTATGFVTAGRCVMAIGVGLCTVTATGVVTLVGCRVGFSVETADGGKISLMSSSEVDSLELPEGFFTGSAQPHHIKQTHNITLTILFAGDAVLPHRLAKRPLQTVFAGH